MKVFVSVLKGRYLPCLYHFGLYHKQSSCQLRVGFYHFLDGISFYVGSVSLAICFREYIIYILHLYQLCDFTTFKLDIDIRGDELEAQGYSEEQITQMLIDEGYINGKVGPN